MSAGSGAGSVSRRDAIRGAAALVGGALFASSGVLSACATERAGASAAVSAGDQELITAIADTLLPATAASPGARDAGVGPLIALWLTDCHTDAERRSVVAALATFRAACRNRTGAEFGALPRERREAFLRELDAERRAGGGDHYFTAMRDLATRAYFSTQAGVTQALRYVPVPGRWEGCVPLQKGQPAWA